jgi:glycosyltransferase involved in cell wall biosynthesis
LKILITSIVDLKSSQHNRPHQFVKYLSKIHDITVLSINDWWKSGQGDLESYSSDFGTIFERINIIHLTDKKVSPILQELLSSKRVKEIADDGFDVHLNYSTLRSGYMAAKGINTVYDIADDLGAMIRSSPQIPKLLRPLGGVLGNFLIKRNINISKVVTVTTEKLIDSYNIPKNKSKIIPNGVDTELFRDCGNVKREELKLDGFIIGYVGVLREWVDLKPVFIALSKLNKDVKMLVVGKEGNFKENVALARQYGVGDRVIFTGMVPYSQVPEYISAMDVCLIPFQQGDVSENALPLKLFEYMACNRPVISTKLSSIENTAGDNVMYADNSDEYESRILSLHDCEHLRHKMGLSGRRLVESNYNWAEIVEQLERVLIRASLEN